METAVEILLGGKTDNKTMQSVIQEAAEILSNDSEPICLEMNRTYIVNKAIRLALEIL